jgi:hypothetical protein
MLHYPYFVRTVFAAFVSKTAHGLPNFPVFFTTEIVDVRRRGEGH